MGPIAAIASAFLAGLTVCGLAGCLMELITGRQLSLAAPFISTGHVLRSLLLAALAGPYMLLNDALVSWRGAAIQTPALCVCAGAAGIWALVTGMVTLELASHVVVLLS